MKWLCAVIFPEKYHGEHPTLGMETKKINHQLAA